MFWSSWPLAWACWYFSRPTNSNPAPGYNPGCHRFGPLPVDEQIGQPHIRLIILGILLPQAPAGQILPAQIFPGLLHQGVIHIGSHGGRPFLNQTVQHLLRLLVPRLLPAVSSTAFSQLGVLPAFLFAAGHTAVPGFPPPAQNIDLVVQISVVLADLGRCK